MTRKERQYLKAVESALSKVAAQNKTLKTELRQRELMEQRNHNALKAMIDSDAVDAKWWMFNNWGYIIASLALKGYDKTRREVRHVPPEYKEIAAKMIIDAEKAIKDGCSVFFVRDQSVGKRYSPSGRH